VRRRAASDQRAILVRSRDEIAGAIACQTVDNGARQAQTAGKSPVSQTRDLRIQRIAE
jgi:hypothetical protein